MKKLIIFLTLFFGLGFVASGMAGDYTDNNDGTITDNETGLMWMKSTMDVNEDGKIDYSDELTWQKALENCETLKYAGYSDWRLPSIEELRSIVDYSTYGPAIDTDYFNVQSSYYWSSTTSADSTGYAWLVNFYYGNGVSDVGHKSYDYYVRAVRSGQ